MNDLNKYIFVVLVKDNNSDLADDAVTTHVFFFFVDLLILTKQNKSEPPAKINVILRVWNCICF